MGQWRCSSVGVSVATVSAFMLTACSTVDFRQLRAEDLAAKPMAPAGAVYYLPKPYLLVAQLPLPPAVNTANQAPNPTPPPEGQSQGHGASNDGSSAFPQSFGGADEPKDAKDAKDDKADDELPAPGGSSDFSFGGTSNGYMLKIVYLPDLTRPMSMSITAGLGTASLKPTLVNGWALTGFDASADSKTAEILASVAQVIGAYKNPAKADKGGGSDDKSGGGRSEVLKPGLYEFHYDRWGRLVALCPVNYFDETGAVEVQRSARCVS